jgi:uncharacterized phage-like protein YoqJ
MIYTSYFAKIRKFPDNIIPVSIARFQPKWLDKNITICNELAPSIKCLTDYKETNNQDEYIKAYTEDVLSKYKAYDIIKPLESKTRIKDVVNNPNTHIALCCYEKPTDFCHRHLLADFLEKENIMIQELDDKTIEDMKNKSVIIDENNMNSIGLDINKTVCFTGRRPKYLFGYNDDKSYLELMHYMYDIVKNAYNKGYRNFITGGAQGFDQLMFRVVSKLKRDNPNTNIKNIVYLPCKEQSSKWGKEGLFGSDNYDKMLKAADDIYYVSDIYTNTCLMDRNRAMIDNSSLVIALYDDENWYNEERLRNTSGTLNALKYALNKHRNIYQISFNEKDILNTLQFSEIFDFIKSTGLELKNNDDYLFGINEGIVCQQVNCKGVMGAGLAKAISDKFPIVKEKYLENYKKNKGIQLGSFQIIDVAVTSSDFLAVCNLYTQDSYGNSSITKKCYTDKELLINAIDCVCSSNPNTKVYIPIKIGCGLAGGNWEEIKEEIVNLVKKRNINNAYFLDTLEKKAFYIKQTGEIIQVPTDEELNKENPFKEDSYEKE